MAKRLKRDKKRVNPQKGVPKTKDALEPKDRAKLLAAAKQVGRVEGLDAWKVCMVFLYTGMHTSVLSNTRKSRVSVIDKRSIRWLRPKKKGSPAVTEIPLHPELKLWIEDFIHDPDLRTNNLAYWRCVRTCGIVAGLENVSPMSLRHTFAVILDEWGFTAAEICLMLNCSPRTVLRYTSRTRKSVEEKLFKRGWGEKDISSEPMNVHDGEPTINGFGQSEPEFRYHGKHEGEWKS